MNPTLFNAHVPLHLRTFSSKAKALDMHVYDNVHELVNYHAYQYMPTLLKVNDFTDEHKAEAAKVLNGEDSDHYIKYGTYWRNGLPRCTVQLLQDRNTRRAIILFSDEYPQPSCLSSVQFLIRNQQLELIANFRSWELQVYAKYDICLLLEMAKEVSRHLADIPLGNLYINAASAHIIINT